MQKAVIDFWFSELGPSQWFKQDDSVDTEIIDRFTGLHEQAIAGELWSWRQEPLGALAEIIILDQFSRNMFREDPRAFASDSLALALSQNAIDREFDTALPQDQRAFLYMPFMHSESLMIHTEAVKLFTQLGNENNLDYELRHKAIIERFGRYPHRNDVLGRQSTEQELAFLDTPGSRF